MSKQKDSLTYTDRLRVLAALHPEVSKDLLWIADEIDEEREAAPDRLRREGAEAAAKVADAIGKPHREHCAEVHPSDEEYAIAFECAYTSKQIAQAIRALYPAEGGTSSALHPEAPRPGTLPRRAHTNTWLSEAQIKHMAERFLSWRLPEINRMGDRFPGWRLPENFTSLFDAEQADAMVRHMIEGLPPHHPADVALGLAP